MKGIVFLLLLMAVAIKGQLSEDCEYVKSNYYLNESDKVERCFNTYQIDQDILDAIIRNLEIVHDIYPYTDIAMKPPSKPAGYFKTMNFTSGLENLKSEFAKSDRIVSKVFRPTMRLVNGFRDDHFNLNVGKVPGKYENIFATVDSFLPFKWNAVVDGNRRIVYVQSPDSNYLNQTACDTINLLYSQGSFASLVDGKDAFQFFAELLGDFNTGKSPKRALNNAMDCETRDTGIDLLRYPLDNLFDEHTITFSDSSATQVSFKLAFRNWGNSPSGTREVLAKKKHVEDVSEELEKKFWTVLKNFKKRSVKQAHRLLPCDTVLNTGINMNYLQIPTFNVETESELLLFLQEMEECVALFDTNSAPITVIFPRNGGGLAPLRAFVQYVLMPASDFRTTRAMRKSEFSKRIAPSIIGDRRLSDGPDSCDAIPNYTEFEAFWEKTDVDNFGDNVVHRRTKKMLEDYKEEMEELDSFKMTRNVRNPTDIVVATDGSCFSACAFFVANIIRAGAAIVAGFGMTNPGDDLFTACECPSGVDVMSTRFDEVSNNSLYGLNVRSTTTESYDVSESMDGIIPGDYSIFRVDKHTGYYGSYNARSLNDLFNLLNKTYDVYDYFKTSCNPDNKRLLLVTDQCKSTKPFSTLSGYACGSDGTWDRSECKVARCRDGYVVDFENDECVPNLCDFRYIPPSPSQSISSSSPQTSTKSSSEKSASCSLHPVMSVLIPAVIVALVHFIL